MWRTLGTGHNYWYMYSLMLIPSIYLNTDPYASVNAYFLKVALGVCFALKSWNEYVLLFTYLITLGKDVTLPIITKFKTNRPLSNLFVNRIPN